MLDNFQHYADEMLEKHRLPALSMAVWKDGTLHKAASGILNIDTGVEATTDSIFQIGSITKVFTASLMMKLVEEGRVDLDKPVIHYLRSFQVADRKATETITVGQLLNHTNGIAGDYFVDDQNEDGPHIARFIDRCSQLPLVHPVGDGFSYSNVGFAVAGRLIEVVTGMSWFDAMEALIYQPLGMKQAICRPADVIRFRAALGHLPQKNQAEPWRTCSGNYLCLGLSSAGTTPTMTASDLILFGRAHMEKGLNGKCERWLSEESVRAMQTPSVEMPTPSDIIRSSMGRGWGLSQHLASGECYASHTGGTNGQCALLRIFPEQQACFVLQMNEQNLSALMDIGNELTEKIAGLSLTPSAEKPEINLSLKALEKLVGHFRSYGGDYTVTLGADGISATFVDSVNEEDTLKLKLKPLGEECFDQQNEQGISEGIVRFMNPDAQGRPSRLFVSARIFQRVA